MATTPRPACITAVRKSVWSKRSESLTQNNFGQENDAPEKGQKKGTIEIDKNLYPVWDSNDGGSLSQHELVRSLVRLELSQDHVFAQ